MLASTEGNSTFSTLRNSATLQGSLKDYGLLPENKDCVAAQQINKEYRKEECFSGSVEQDINEYTSSYVDPCMD